MGPFDDTAGLGPETIPQPDGSPRVQESAPNADAVRRPVTLAPPPPQDLDGGAPANGAKEPAGVTQPAPGFSADQHATSSVGTVVPWAAAAILLGAALIAWAVHSRVRAARATNAVQNANTAAASADQQLADDMTELSDRIARELDARAQRLERLIATADTKIAELTAVGDRIARLPTVGAPATRTQTSHTEVKPVPAKVMAMADEAGSEAGNDPGIAAIYQLADEGLSAVQIAQRTGRGTGQVELVLNLRRAARGM